jgi:acetyl-CoA carboxylase carboxyltransferase component
MTSPVPDTTSGPGPEPETPARLRTVLDARAATLDGARPDAVARQHARGRWTARERIEALYDPATFVEYGQLVTPANRQLGDGPADGLVMGVGKVDGHDVCAFSYDYTVFGGSQSPRNHRKMDRLLELAGRHRWPVVCWSEGGGARASELNYQSGMVTTFVQFPRLSGLVPIVTVLSGPSFAGQANIAGCSDVVIATRASTLGLSGPPLVLSATGERLSPEDLGPIDLHERIGTVDVVVDDEAEALDAVRRYLDYFRGPRPSGEAPPGPEQLRAIVPENPRRAYDMRRVVTGIADLGSVLELRPRFGRCITTSLARFAGRPVGVIGNNPMFGAGAIDRDGSDKISRHIELCNAFDLPILFLCDTPGFMIGRAAEETALVRHSARTIMALANVDVPILSVVLRKAYGLAYYVMGSDAFQPDLLVGWPTAEFGGMGLEGAVNIVFREEIEAAPDEEARKRIRLERTAELKERNTGLRLAQSFGLDDVIDPAETRDVLVRALATFPVRPPRTTRKHPIDPW